MRNHSSISVDFGNGRKTWTRSLHPHSYLVTLKVLSLHIQLFSITVRLMPGSLAPDIFQNKFIFIGLNSEICFRMSQNSNKTIPTSYTTVTNSVVKANTAGPCTQFVAQTSIYITLSLSQQIKNYSFQSILGVGGEWLVSIDRLAVLVMSLCTRTISEGVTIKYCFALLVKHLTVCFLCVNYFVAKCFSTWQIE